MARRKVEPEVTIVSAGVLCDYLNLTERNLHQLVQAKVLARHDHGLYDLKACTQAYITHIKNRIEKSKAATEGTLTSERARLTKAKADEAELKARARAGELVEISDVARAWDKIASVLRARMLTIPSKLAARLATTSKAADVQRALEREINDALSALSKVKVESEEPADQDD